MNPSLPYAHKAREMRLPPSGMGMRFRTSPRAADNHHVETNDTAMVTTNPLQHRSIESNLG